MNKKSRRGLKRKNRKSLRKRGGAAQASKEELYNAYVALREIYPNKQPLPGAEHNLLVQRKKLSIYEMLRILHPIKEPPSRVVDDIFDLPLSSLAVYEFDPFNNLHKKGIKKQGTNPVPMNPGIVRNIFDKYGIVEPFY